MTTAHLVGISGSLRSASYNTALLRAAFEDLPGGVTAGMASLKGIPLYDQDDITEHGTPDSVNELRSAVRQADGIVFANPEYNWSVTGAMKNAIDWLSGGPDSPLDLKPAAIIGVGADRGQPGHRATSAASWATTASASLRTPRSWSRVSADDSTESNSPTRTSGANLV